MCMYKVSMLCNEKPYDLTLSAENKSHANLESTLFMMSNAPWPINMKDSEKLKHIVVKSVSEYYHI